MLEFLFPKLKKYIEFSLIVLCVLSMANIYSQNNSNTLDATGINSAYQNNTKIRVEDPDLNNSSTYETITSRSLLAIEFDSSQSNIDAYTTELTFDVAPLLSDGTPDNSNLVTKILEIEYNPLDNSGNFNDKALFETTSNYGIEIEITNINTVNTNTNSSSNTVPDNVNLELLFEADRIFELGTSIQTAVTISPDANNEKFLVTWNPIAGAESYELEWSWIDNYGNAEGVFIDTDMAFTIEDFEANNTRVLTSESNGNLSYEIPAIYDRGYLMARVRGVGRFITPPYSILKGRWSMESSTTVSSWGNAYTEVMNAHESKKNWQFQASYAEDGKKKEVVSYFDGTLRNRQTVTKINTESNAIVGEVIYDNQGRPGVEVLPVPVPNSETNELKFYQDFNLSDAYSNQIFTHFDFDWDGSLSDLANCGIDANGISNSSGSSLYYSSNYDNSGGFHDYVPDAHNYPFSQIEYTPDNTGRIKRKGGVGLAHQLGSGHEMKYMYSSADQKELDRLFGSQVGWDYHYKKNAVVDPNGQVSVSYIDPQGRTIATALTADSPSAMQELKNAGAQTSLTHESTTVDLVTGENNRLIKSGNLKGLNINDALHYQGFRSVLSNNSQHDFNYQLNNNDVFIHDCLDHLSTGYPFIFDLTLNATDECGESLLDNGKIYKQIGSYTTSIQSFDLTQIDGTIEQISFDSVNLVSSSVGTSETFSATPQLGDMGIHKTLQINEEALDAFAEDYILKLQQTNDSCILQPSDFNVAITSQDCFESCQECLDSIGTQINYVQEQMAPYILLYEGDQPTLDALEDRFIREHELLLEGCNAICNDSEDGVSESGSNPNFTNSITCNLVYDFLLDDVKKTGQYGYEEYVFNEGQELADNQTAQLVADEVSIFKDNNQLYTGFAAHIRNESPPSSPYTWKDPFHPDYTGADAMHYYEPDRVTISMIELIKQPDGTWLPQSEFNDSTLNSMDTDGDGKVEVEPTDLTLDAFLNNWQPSWANSLVIYHPEYCYVDYANIMCQMTLTGVAIDGRTVDMNIDGFENILNEMDFTTAKNEGFLDAQSNSLDNIMAVDPFFANQLPTSELGTYLSNNNIHSDIMEHALTNEYQGTNKIILERAYYIAVCNSVEFCNGNVSNNYWNSLNDTNKNKLWQTYKSLYLSLRRTIYDALAHSYALDNDCYNGCIGENGNDLADLGLNAFYPNIPQPGQSSNAICESTSSFYASKQKRYLTADAIYDSGESTQNLYDEFKEEYEIANYTETGQCPLASDLLMFFNGLIGEDLSSGSTPLKSILRNNDNFTGSYLSMDLFTELGGQPTSSSVPNDNITIDTQISNKDLTIVLSQGSAYPGINLTLPSNFNDNWNGYTDIGGNGNGFAITDFSQFQYTAYDTSTTPTTFTFQVVADVYDVSSGQIVDSTFKQIVITGTTTIRIGECYLSGEQAELDGNGNPIGEGVGGNGEDVPFCEDDGYQHLGLITLLSSTDQNYYSTNGPLNDSDRVKIADNLVGFLNDFTNHPNYQSNLYLTHIHDLETRPYRFISKQKYVYGDLIRTTSSAEIHVRLASNSNHIYMYIQDNDYPDHLLDVMDGITYGSTHQTIPMDILFIVVGSDKYGNIINTQNSYQNLLNSGKTQKVFFIILEGHNSIKNLADGSLVSPYDFINQVMGDNYTPVEFTESLGLLNSDYISFTENEFINTNSLQDFLIENYNPINFQQSDCLNCLPQTIPAVSHTEKYTDFINDVSTITNYQVPSLYTPEYFAQLKYGLIVDGYSDYLNILNITSVEDSNFITLPEFGATALNYGYNDYATVITAYKNYLTNTTDNPVDSWASFVDDYLVENNDICPPPMVDQNINITLPPENNCEEFFVSVNEAYGVDNYNDYLARLKREFKIAYTEAALASVSESMDLTYEDKEYQYTLYYYDQAGNLAQTVPPEGVNRIEFNDLEDAEDESIFNPDRAANTVNVTLPDHKLRTEYKYNSLNQLTRQKTPDGGETYFAYDVLGRIIASQNALQSPSSERNMGTSNYQFSYTLYDGIGRIIEAGEINIDDSSSNFNYTISDDGLLLQNGNRVNDFDLAFGSETRNQVTITTYDTMVDGKDVLFASYANNDRNRVTAISYYENYSGVGNPENAIYYDYDVHGNVKEMITEVNDPILITMGQNVKTVSYDYDLISGNVNYVYYQKDQPDQFIHRYEYDADNRIVAVYTSADNRIWEKDAKYDYYEHGPLARSVIGDKEVQGMDYAYTLQGWLKGVNSENLNSSDIGNDGSFTAKDAFAYNLNYYQNYTSPSGSSISDYSPRNTTSPFSTSKTHYQANVDLYNGNIRGMTTALMDMDQNKINVAYNNYQYDQLNRIVGMTNAEGSPTGGTPTSSGVTTAYSYDRNGNLKTLNRRALNSSGVDVDMDDLSYVYNTDIDGDLVNNQLKIVNDDPSLSGNFDNDIDNHTSDYEYDEIGQLTQDVDENIQEILWRVDGKVKSIEKSDGTIIAFDYDGLGNRLAKSNSNTNETTYYIRDAQGNVLSIYKLTDAGSGGGSGDFDVFLQNGSVTTTETVVAQNNIEVAGGSFIYSVEPSGNLTLTAGNAVILKPGFTAKAGGQFLAEIDEGTGGPTENTLDLEEQLIYGSSRLGMQQPQITIHPEETNPEPNTYKRTVGDKRYELSNHLGNVLTVVSDKKLEENGIFMADVLSYSDFYPFGMLVPNRHGTSDSYRYGFQGQERDDEIKGQANSYDYGARMHDPRTGRWLTLDAINKSSQGNYNYASNSPIMFVDKGGNDDYYYDRLTGSVYVIRNGAPHRFIFIEHIFSKPGDNGIQVGEPVLIQYPSNHDKVKELFYEHNVVFRDALKHARGGDYEKTYNAYSNLGNTEAAKILAVGLGAPILVVVGVEVLAAYGAEAIGTFVLNEIKDEALSQATNGASDVLDITKMAYRGGKQVLEVVIDEGSEEGVTLLYRSVDDAELEDIANKGVLRMKPEGGYDTGKLFAQSADDAAVQSVQNYGFDKTPFTIIEVEVPNSVLKRAEIQKLDMYPGGMSEASLKIMPIDLKKIKIKTELDISPIPKINTTNN